MLDALSGGVEKEPFRTTVHSAIPCNSFLADMLQTPEWGLFDGEMQLRCSCSADAGSSGRAWSVEGMDVWVCKSSRVECKYHDVSSRYSSTWCCDC